MQGHLRKTFRWAAVVAGAIAVLLPVYAWIIAPVRGCPPGSRSETGAGWTCLTSLPTSRSEIGVAVLDGVIYVGGGMNRWGRVAAFEA